MSSSPGAGAIRLTVLDALALEREPVGACGSVLSQPKRLALLVYLVLARPRGMHQRDKLLALFWPELDTDRARAALSQSVYVLRRGLGAEAIVSLGADQVGVDRGRIRCDAIAFEEACESGDEARALDLYRGELLEGFFPGGSAELDEWLEGERLRFRGLAARAAGRLSERALAAGDVAGAIATARRACSLAPSDEGALRRLMDLLAGAGNRAEALAEYERYARWLRAELEVEPAGATRELVSTIIADAAPRERVVATPLPAGLTKSPSSAGPPRQWPWARARIAALALLVLLAASSWSMLARRTTNGADPARIAVLPFDVDAGDGLRYLGEGMVDMLSAQLDGAGELRAVDSRAVLGAARRERDGAAVAAALGAGRYIEGRVVQANGLLHLSATLRDATSRVRARASASAASEDQLVAAVDALSRDLLRGSYDAEPGSIAGLTTSSLAALKAYLNGEQQLREGHAGRALEHFLEAVAADSSFALAYYRLALASDLVAAPEINGRARARARALAGRLPEHTRVLLRAYDDYQVGDFARAEHKLRDVLRYRPELSEAWLQLGEAVFHTAPLQGRSFTEARTAFETVLAADPYNVEALIHLLRIAVYERRRLEADTLLRALLPRLPDASRRAEAEALVAFGFDDAKLQGRVAEQIRLVPPEAVWPIAQRLGTYTENLEGVVAVSALASGDAPPDVRMLRHLVAAQAEAGRGRWHAAAREFDQVERLNPHALEFRAAVAAQPYVPTPAAEARAIAERLAQVDLGERLPGSQYARQPMRAALRHYYLGMLYLKAGDVERAETHVALLERAGSELLGDSRYVACAALVLRAAVLRARGETRRALETIEAARSVVNERNDHPRYAAFSPTTERLLRAQLLHELGRDDEALAWAGALNEDLSFAFPYAAGWLLRGDILARRGDRAGAIVAYNRMLELWADADDPIQRELVRVRAWLQPDVQRSASRTR